MRKVKSKKSNYLLLFCGALLVLILVVLITDTKGRKMDIPNNVFIGMRFPLCCNLLIIPRTNGLKNCRNREHLPMMM